MTMISKADAQNAKAHTARGMKIYVAGPMRGIPEFNFPAFDNAADHLRELGHEVCNPADHDREKYGTDVSPENDKGFDLRDALAWDLDWIARNADAVAVLDGWKSSSGARAEVALAHALSLRVARVECFRSADAPDGGTPQPFIVSELDLAAMRRAEVAGV